MADLILVSPMAGWAAPLDEVPDPVFAERMLGDGLAIDPVGSTLHAPCAGTVIQLHAARHAVTLRAADGTEILMHIGLETVALNGEGFTAHVAEGAQVAAGDLLIGFDLDLLARRAKSLITPIVVLGADASSFTMRTLGQTVAVGAPLMRVRASGPAGEAAAAPPEAMRTLAAPLAHGFHARPAARIAALAQGFQAAVEVTALGRRASARSPIGLMGLGVRLGDAVTLAASGPDAAKAVEALAELIAGGMGEAAPPPGPATPRTAPAPA
ncbi:MAG: glucose PTS transporter subunit IIA, partial [Caulobacteraceae bacterium]|nr:glucose PTS transporter subunit IIA [Caulobacteraceae bacterium]